MEIQALQDPNTSIKTQLDSLIEKRTFSRTLTVETYA